MIQNYVISFIRTYVPIGVGALIAYLAVHFGINVDNNTAAGLIVFLTAVFQGAYYALARTLEHWKPQLGALLGVPAKPNYPDASLGGDKGAADGLLILLVAILILALILGFGVHPLFFLLILVLVAVWLFAR